MEMIGKLYEDEGDVTMKWKIKDFSSFQPKTNEYYFSPKFHFSGASWNIRIYPCGDTKDTSNWIGLFLIKKSAGIPVTAKYSLAIMKVDKNVSNCCFTRVFDKKDTGWGRSKIMLRSDLMGKKSEIFPSDVLTVICTIKHSEPKIVEDSLFSRYDELIDVVTKIYKNAKMTDVVLKVSGQDIPAHRLILEERSPVFAAMFKHDMKEKQTSEINIEDIDKSTMEVILEYLYSGDIGNLTTDTVLSIYAAAEKYDIKQIKHICSEFIIRNLSVDWFCDVVKFVELYEDKDVILHIREYFNENARKIMQTEKWKMFVKEKNDITLELYGSMLSDLLAE